MKRTIFYQFIFLLLFFFAIPLHTSLATDEYRYMIGFKEEIDPALIEQYDGKVEQLLPSIQAIAASFSQPIAKELVTQPPIRYVEEDDPVSISEQQTVDWGVRSTNAPMIWKNGLKGKGVKVAVIDTGIYTKHPDLEVTKGFSVVGYTDSFEDDNGHGTKVAGIVAAKNNSFGIVGMAPDVDLYVVKAFDESGDGYHSNLIKAIDWAVKQKVDIINLSVGSSTYSKGLLTAVNDAYDKGVLIVAAAGNGGNLEGKGDQVEFPAAFESAIAVAAIDRYDRRAGFSATGPQIEVAAPGVKVLTTSLSGEYEYASGTSLAAPHVTGHLALLKQAYPKLRASELRELLHAQTIDLTGEGRNRYLGYGKIELPSELTIQEDNTPPSIGFLDVYENLWYTSAINTLVSRNIIFGYEDNTFRPHHPITRAETVTMLQRALQLPSSQYDASYKDVKPTHFAASSISALKERQYVSSYPDGSFRPEAPITRGEVATILSRIEPMNENNKATFPDIPTNHFAKEAIESIAGAGVIQGYPDGTFRPNQTITRAEFSVLIDRIILK